MSNITPILNTYLEPHKTHGALHPRTRASTRDEFLKEAYRIAAHTSSLQTYLLSIRQAYLSTSTTSAHPTRVPKHPQLQSPRPGHASAHLSVALTNPDRDAIDTSSKTILRDLSASLRQLTDAESLRRQTWHRIHAAKYKRRGLLASWAAGDAAGEKSEEQRKEEGEEETLAGVRASVIWYLGRKVEGAAEVQRGMVERRVKREVERGRSVLYLVKNGGAGAVGGAQDFLGERGGGGRDGYGGGGDGARRGGGGGGGVGEGIGKAALVEEEESERRKIEEQLTPEQLQLFARENQDMLKHYEDTLDQVRTAESSMLEISSLQTTLAQNLDIQSSHISQLVADSLSTTENVGMGNKELKKASERKSTARMVFWASCGLSLVLVGWDLIF